MTGTHITILGAGAWGTALAIALAGRQPVTLWGRNAEAIAEAGRCRDNRAYLPGYPLPPALNLSADLESTLARAGADQQSGQGLLIIASAVAGLRPLLDAIHRHPVRQVVWLCKGLEEGSGLLPHQIVQDVLGDAVAAGVLSGPSFAQEVAQGLPCALVIASANAALREQVVAAVHAPALRVYASDDVVGVEIGGAVKNILAIAAGVLDGMGLGLNARAALITRGLAEMTRLGVALGARADTFMGLAGVGDLILTCTGDLSRNRKVGLGLAQGKPLDTIVRELGHVAEGVRCAQVVRALASARGVEMPIADAVATVLFDGVSAQDMVGRLLARGPRDESAGA